MAGGKGNNNVNSKAAAGRARKAENEAKQASERDAQAEAREAKVWQDGADLRGAARAQSAADKADEAARKRREKALLQAEEEANLGSGGKVKAAAPKSSNSKKKKDDLSLLENALVKDAEKKLRAKKERDAQLKREEAEAERRRNEEEEEKRKNVDPLLLNTQAMLGGLGVDDDNSQDGHDMLVGRKANVAAFEENAASGIDAALDAVGVSPGGGGGEVKSMKALYAAFEARMLPKFKEDYPGLRLTQYKERIFQLWQKSPENPANQVVPK